MAVPTNLTVLLALLIFLTSPVAVLANNSVTVEVEGIAPLTDEDFLEAREIAISDALRTAVEQVVGTLVDSETRVENYQVIEDSILTQSTGYVTSYEVLKTWTEWGYLKVLVRAVVKKGEIIKELDALQLTYQRAGKPKVMVIIPEQHIRRPVPDPAAETEIIRQLLEVGFKVVDQSQVKKARQTESFRRAISGDTDACRQLAAQYDAEIIVIGEAFSEYVGNFQGLISCRARVEVRVVRADTGEILAAHGVQESGVDLTEGVAAKKALAKAAETMAAYLVTAIPSKLKDSARNLELTVTGISFQQLIELEKELNNIYMVENVYVRDFVGDTARIDVDTPLLPMQLAKEISEKSTISLEVIGVSGNKIELKYNDCPTKRLD